MAEYVGPEGSIEAEIVGIGEAPASQEAYHGRPFVGPSGQYLNDFIKMAGLYRGEMYLTNIHKYRCPGDKISKLGPMTLMQSKKDLIEEINNLKNPKILVPFGDYALRAVTDKKGITNFRGSVLKPKRTIEHDCIVIPTFHPSILHYENYHLWPLIVADLSKVARIKNEGFKFHFPEFNFLVKPDLSKVFAILDWIVEQKHEMVVIDVETPHQLLSCIGLAWSRSDGICIPFYWGTGQNYWSFEQEMLLWKKLSEVLPKLNLAGQNVFFDWEILYEHGIKLKPAVWDSMLMHGCLYSEMKHNLETIVSIYTDMEFYKKDDDEETKRSALRAGQEMNHWDYNLRDCTSTFWSIEELKRELIEENMLDFYLEFYASMIEPYFNMNMKGIPVDVERLPEVREGMLKEIENNEAKITLDIGHPINVKSPPQVSAALYDEKKWKPQLDRKTKKRTVNKKAMEALAYKYQSETPALIQQTREDYVFLSLFKEENIEDDCFKCSYSLARTKTGRLSARKSYSGKGRALHNVKSKGITRTFFIPEKGHVMIGGDGKQAEARVVAWYSKDENYITIAESGKIHLMVGAMVYDDPEFNKSNPNYRSAKALVHGSNYRMTPFGFAREANITAARAKIEHAKFHALFPGIVNVYYKYIEECIKSTRMLYNVFGRRQVFFKKIDEKCFKAGSAFIPQSSVSDITKQAVKKMEKYYRVLLDHHDGAYISVPRKEEKIGIELIQEAFHIPFKIWGIERVIPIEVTVGENWGEMEVVKI